MRPHAFLVLSTLVCLAAPVIPAQSSGAPTTATPSEPVLTLHSSTRMVTVEVVARDHQGRPATGLTANDFQVFEQAAGWRKEKREQKISVFRAMGITESVADKGASAKFPAGVFTNLIPAQKRPVPPTILLVDGLNTELTVQMQVHIQMVRMLRSIPADTPVAVFLLGHRLKMLQSFTTDPALLKAALDRAATAAVGAVQLDPRDDPDTLSAFMEDMPNVPASALASIQRFEQDTYVTNLDLRVKETMEALTSIARHVAGYPGRKSLLWISSSFPLVLLPDMSGFEGFRQYQGQMQAVANLLAEAKVAVYPIDPGGLQTQSYFDAGRRLRSSAIRNPAGTLDRESTLRINTQATMDTVAEQTGGRVCVNHNDLGDCIGKAMNDSNAFYEIAYYPNSQDWNGEFRKIIVKVSRPGLNLSYRQGYYARTERTKDPKAMKVELQQASCEDYLNATSVTLLARNLPGNAPGQLKYYIAIDPTTITFTPADDGSQQVKLTLAVCTFDKSGKPLQLMTEAVDRKLNPKEYQSVETMGSFPHVLALVPSTKPNSVRVLVKDELTGQFGSVNVPVSSASAPDGAQTATVH